MEEWRGIAGYDGYEVSDLGRVRCWRAVNRMAKPPAEPRVLKPVVTSYGRAVVTLYSDGKAKIRQVSQLVLEAFRGARPPGCQARHVLSNDRLDNRLENLEWGSAQENIDDRERHGTTARGSRQGLAKLSEDAVAAILTSDLPAGFLAVVHGVSPHTIRTIRRRNTWKHVEIGAQS